MNSSRSRSPRTAEVEGAVATLTVVDALDLRGYGPRHAVRADLLRRLGCTFQAQDAYDAAIASAGNEAERAFLARRRAELHG